MTPFVRIKQDPTAVMVTRQSLLQKEDAFFAGLFGGRIPTMTEKLVAIEQALLKMGTAPIYQNDIYTVQVDNCAPFIHLHIHRNDWGPCKDWKHFQLIKNELVGPEHEAIELFPAESRLVDTSNTYHLWVHSTPGFRFEVGLQHRMVSATPIGVEGQRWQAA